MKHLSKYLLFLLLPFLANCSDNENWTIVEDIQQGVYISGTATAYSGEAPASALRAIALDGDVKELPELVGIYTWLKSGGDFTISIATDLNQVVKYGNGGEVSKTDVISVYTLAQDAAPLKVEKDGFYYVIVNTALKEINILPTTYGVIGAATPKGWDGETALGAPSFDDRLTITWKGKLNMTPGGYKFRYSGGWGQEINKEGGKAKIFTDLGNFGTSQAPLIENAMSQVRPGGPDFTTEVGGEFEFTIQYDLRTRAYNATYDIIGEAVVPPKYPDNLYINGGDFGGTNWDWNAPGIVTMNPVNGLPHAFWAIVYVSANGEFKFAPQKAWSGDFGVTGSSANGIYNKGGDNVKVTEAGYYMVYIDLETNRISVTAPEVYLIGATVGNKWEYKIPAGKFTVDNTNKKIVSPAFPAGGELRMYATCPLSQQNSPKAVEWWQMEFIVLNGKIEYRGNGGEQTRVNVTAGQKVTLDFSNGTGTVQ